MATSSSSSSEVPMMTAENIKDYLKRHSIKGAVPPPAITSSPFATGAPGVTGAVDSEAKAKVEVKLKSEAKAKAKKEAKKEVSAPSASNPPMKTVREMDNEDVSTGIGGGDVSHEEEGDGRAEVKIYRSIRLDRLTFQAKFLLSDEKQIVYKQTLQAFQDLEDDDEMIAQVAKGYLKRYLPDSKGDLVLTDEKALTIQSDLRNRAIRYIKCADSNAELKLKIKDEIVRSIQCNNPFDRSFYLGQRCEWCTQPKTLKCKRCGVADYCKIEHASHHFKVHKPQCKKLKISYMEQIAVNTKKFGPTVAFMMANNVWSISTSLTAAETKLFLAGMTTGPNKVNYLSSTRCASGGCTPMPPAPRYTTEAGEIVDPLTGGCTPIPPAKSDVDKKVDDVDKKVDDAADDSSNASDSKSQLDSKSQSDSKGNSGGRGGATPTSGGKGDSAPLLEWLATHHAPSSLKIYTSDGDIVEVCISVNQMVKCRNCKIKKASFCRNCTLVNCCSSCQTTVHTKGACKETVDRLTLSVRYIAFKGNKFNSESFKK